MSLWSSKSEGFAANQASSQKARPLKVSGAYVFYGAGRFQDDRGFYEEINFEPHPSSPSERPIVRQCGYSSSSQNVLRGIHCSPYGKMVTCLSGSLWDVVVDLRPKSPTFLRWDAARLSPDDNTRMYIPPHCGHGFLSLEENTVCLYMKLGCFNKQEEVEVSAFDPQVDIKWPKPIGAEEYIMSVKDRSLPPVSQVLKLHASPISSLTQAWDAASSNAGHAVLVPCAAQTTQETKKVSRL